MADNTTGGLGVPNIEDALLQRGFRVRGNKLGEGGFGKVVMAKSEHDGKLYAIKLIVPLVHGQSGKYHKRELELLTRLEMSKRNVIKYFGSWILESGHLCIQMELCSVNLLTFIYENEMGGVEIIKARGSPRFYQQIFVQILNGLVAIHSIGWVHRDIHPGNILIANPNPQRIRDIRVKIADFGLARYIQMGFKKSPNLTTVVPALEKLSPGIGHNLFRAPELSTENYDFKVDIYSSGIVMYLLNRYLPNSDQLKGEILALREGKRKLEHLCHKDDQGFVKLLRRLLHKEPTSRPTAVEALAYIRSKNLTGKNRIELAEKKFKATKRGHGKWYRFSLNDATLSGIKDAIQRRGCFGIEANDLVLEQKMFIEKEKSLVAITTDQDVREMFGSAEEQGKKVSIVVSEREGRETRGVVRKL